MKQFWMSAVPVKSWVNCPYIRNKMSIQCRLKNRVLQAGQGAKEQSFPYPGIIISQTNNTQKNSQQAVTGWERRSVSPLLCRAFFNNLGRGRIIAGAKGFGFNHRTI